MKESYLKIFLRFLRFGFLAWGGPVAQIAMIRQELVEEKQWISRDYFNRVLAVYQTLPGPEAQELCVYFGMLARGRWGGFLAGLGFMLPGFALMFILSWLYLSFGLISLPFFLSIFAGMKPAVSALIFRAVHRIGGGALTNRWLGVVAVVAGIGQFMGIHFLITLTVAGCATLMISRRFYISAICLKALFLTASLFFFFNVFKFSTEPETLSALSREAPSFLSLFFSGLRTGLLTFGGAYTAIPFLQHDAVISGGWMSNAQFLDGLALSGILPAPLIIFSTFVGYLGGGPIGAMLITIGIFLPAFSFTLIGYKYLEHLVENQTLHSFLEGVTAGVVGLIAVVALELFHASIMDFKTLAIFLLALGALYGWNAKIAVAVVVLGAGGMGLWLL